MSIQTLIYLFTYLFIYLFIYPRRKDYVATYTVINMMKRWTSGGVILSELKVIPVQRTTLPWVYE